MIVKRSFKMDAIYVGLILAAILTGSSSERPSMFLITSLTLTCAQCRTLIAHNFTLVTHKSLQAINMYI